MIRILYVAAILGFSGAALAPVVAWYVERNMTRDVILITPEAPEVVLLQKEMWVKGEPVADIYGKAVDKKIRVVRPDPRDIIVPEEDPSMTLMLANSPRHPLQIQTVWVAVKYVVPSAAIGGIVALFLAWRWRRRRVARPAAALT